MQSPKSILKEAMKQLSSTERKEALKWVDSLSEEKIIEFEVLIKAQLAQVLLKTYLQGKVKTKSSGRQKQ